MKPSAKIILDSISEQGHRLTTMEVVMHRFVLAEMNTHRVFSRNSASSRAIPFKKIAERVSEDPAYPVHWGAEQKGMQSGTELDSDAIEQCVYMWDDVRSWSLVKAHGLAKEGLHKSLINRLLEPFMWHTAIITATEWDNFFWQRCHPDAQPEMKAVADEMQRAYYTSTPKELAHGEWHCPYIQEGEWKEVTKGSVAPEFLVTDYMKAVSVARCARVSYLTQDGKRDRQEDINLFGRLKGSGHWSPFEHIATPIMFDSRDDDAWLCGNFRGWKQFRKEFNGENRTNFVPNLPDLVEWLEQRRVRSMDEPMPESIKSFPHLDRMSQGGE